MGCLIKRRATQRRLSIRKIRARPSPFRVRVSSHRFPDRKVDVVGSVDVKAAKEDREAPNSTSQHPQSRSSRLQVLLARGGSGRDSRTMVLEGLDRETKSLTWALVGIYLADPFLARFAIF